MAWSPRVVLTRSYCKWTLASRLNMHLKASDRVIPGFTWEQ